MEGEYLHTRLRVRIVGRLEFELGHAKLAEELVEDADEVAQGQVAVGDDTFDLMELGQVSGVQGLVSEDLVDREVLCRLEWLLE